MLFLYGTLAVYYFMHSECYPFAGKYHAIQRNILEGILFKSHLALEFSVVRGLKDLAFWKSEL